MFALSRANLPDVLDVRQKSYLTDDRVCAFSHNVRIVSSRQPGASSASDIYKPAQNFRFQRKRQPAITTDYPYWFYKWVIAVEIFNGLF